jgi:hypothetical protein
MELTYEIGEEAYTTETGNTVTNDKPYKVGRQSGLLLNYRLLEKCLEAGGDIRLQDIVIVWNEISSNPVGSRVAFNYIRNKWNTIYDK